MSTQNELQQMIAEMSFLRTTFVRNYVLFLQCLNYVKVKLSLSMTDL